MRPAVRAKEERKWVLDTINKYFDIIVEEEDEEEDEESDEDSDSDSEEPSLSASDEDDPQDYKSSNRMRSLLSKAAANVSSQGNLNRLKQNLGSRISLGGMKQSMDNLASL